MAGDWIKMRTDLYRDPKVCAIADELMHQKGELAAYVNQNCQREMTVTRNVMRNVTVGALVSVWGVMRMRGKRIDDDLVLKSATLWIIDDLAEIPGFGRALQSVGWVEAGESGLVFPNFFSEYNVDPNEDAKAKNAERQRRYREKAKQESNVTQDVTVTSKSNAREEKRREEKNINTGGERSRGSRLPTDWQLSPQDRDFCKTERPDLNPDTVAADFADYWHSVPGAKGVKLDWPATWRGWVRKQFAPKPGAVTQTTTDPDSRASIEAEGVAKGIGAWDSSLEQWPQYKARVRGVPQRQDPAILALVGVALKNTGVAA